MNPEDRFDAGSWKVIAPTAIKRHKYSKGVGFCHRFAVGNSTAGHKEAGVWWSDGAPHLLAVDGRKEVAVRAARGNEIVGFWSASGGNKIGAVLWRLGPGGALEEIDLHQPGYEKTYAMGTGGGAQAGFGNLKPKKGEYGRSRALLWRDGGAPTELISPEWKNSHALGTDGVFQVGYVEGQGGHRAALWRGTGDSLVVLGPDKCASEAFAVRDGEQVGVFATGMVSRAALWKGSVSSLVDLTPEGYEAGKAFDCADGFQVGLILKRDTIPSGSSNMETRAALWHGSREFVDLHRLLPPPWNASFACCVECEGDQIRIIGTAEKVVSTGAGVHAEQALAESTAVIWEGRLKG